MGVRTQVSALVLMREQIDCLMFCTASNNDTLCYCHVLHNSGSFSVAYPAGKFTPGQVLSAPDTHVPPCSVTYQPADTDTDTEAAAGSGKKFTLIITDPDAPDRSEHPFREFVHLVVADLSAEGLAAGGPLAGSTVLEYLGVGAPHGSGRHRYVFLLFAQPEDASPGLLAGAFEGRGGKKVCVEARRAGLGPVVAATWFEAEWHPSIDALHEALGWLPPPQFRSPKQRAANPTSTPTPP
jgi:phosphatidylethanolamine-binding protein (PEBP) family uncharacterized protein